jgi:hypothetical protein
MLEGIIKHILTLFSFYSYCNKYRRETISRNNNWVNPSPSVGVGLEFREPIGRGGPRKCGRCLALTCVHEGPMEYELAPNPLHCVYGMVCF